MPFVGGGREQSNALHSLPCHRLLSRKSGVDWGHQPFALHGGEHHLEAMHIKHYDGIGKVWARASLGRSKTGNPLHPRGRSSPTREQDYYREAGVFQTQDSWLS